MRDLTEDQRQDIAMILNLATERWGTDYAECVRAVIERAYERLEGRYLQQTIDLFTELHDG